MISGENNPLREAEDLLARNEFQKSFAIISSIIAAAPDNAQAHWVLGKLYSHIGQFDQAAKSYTTAVKADPSLSRVDFNFGGTPLIRGGVDIVLEDVAGSVCPAEILVELGRSIYGVDKRTLYPGDIVVDIGAHIGGFSIPLAMLNPQITIFAYEPMPSTYEQLLKNIERNKVTNIVPVNKAVTELGGSIELISSNTSTSGASGFFPKDCADRLINAGWQKQVAVALTLDEVFAAHAITQCQWLKLDCEGAEIGILATAECLGHTNIVSLELHAARSVLKEVGVINYRNNIAKGLTRFVKPPVLEFSSITYFHDQ
jgi:FkbM family methyltransferase